MAISRQPANHQSVKVNLLFSPTFHPYTTASFSARRESIGSSCSSAGLCSSGVISSKHQQDHLVLQNITSKKYSGKSWITGITQIIWHHVYSHWEARNADLHGIDATMQEHAQYDQAQRETEEIYSKCSLVQPCDRDVFYSNTTEHFPKQSTACGLKQWLNTWC